MKKTIYYLTGSQDSGKSFLADQLPDCIEIEFKDNSLRIEGNIEKGIFKNVVITEQVFDWDNYERIKYLSKINNHNFLNINLEKDSLCTF